MLILASRSPRRREILHMLGYDFSVIASGAEESADFSHGIDDAVMNIALTKAAEIARSHPEDIVLGADTVVALDGRVLGKPADADDAADMLRLLSGKTHTVYTGVAILGSGHQCVFCEKTQVTFYPLDDKEIAAYVATGEPMDKAGSYGIQGLGAVLVRRIEGDFFTVMGLPAARVCRALKAFITP